MAESTGSESRVHPLPPLGYLLRQAAAAHRLRMDRALADLSVTPPQFLIMTLIATNPGCSNADIARMASLTTPTVTVILTNLSSRNIFNSIKHPIDKRVKLLKLSETGEALLAECRKRAEVVEDELKAQLSAGDGYIIAAWLQSAAAERPTM